MKRHVLAATVALSAASLAPWLAFAAGEPQLSPEEGAAATAGKSPAQAEQSKMEMKREHDAEKFQNQEAQQGNPSTAGQVGTQQASPSPAPAPQATTEAVKKNP